VICYGCGEDYEADTFIEGWCSDCFEARQAELDWHNAQYNAWKGMTDAQRDKAIKEAGK
jgi:hypothetical protein